MPITMLDQVDFTKIPALNFIPPVVTTDPAVTAADEGRFIYNTTENTVKYCDGVTWNTLGVAGAGAPPSGAAGGDLTGTYPSPQIAAGVIVDSDISGTAGIQQAKVANLPTDLTARALTSTSILAGNGLTGGGTLAANRTLDVGAGTGISVAADTVAVDTAVIATRTYADTAVSNHVALADPHVQYQQESQRGVANGYAPLDANNLIPTTHMPPLAVNDVFTVASQAAMLALVAQVGDMAIRTDTGKTYVLAVEPASVLANWKEVMAAGAVQSVNGQTGIVSLSAANVGAASSGVQVVAGNGLTGGGDLTASRTLDIVGDANLSVGADQVSVLSAPKWTTSRTIQLTGDVTGAAAIDGSANISVSTSFVGGTNLAKHFAGNVPAGTACIVNHALNTRDVTVEVYRSTTPWDTVICDVERTDTNNITLRFAVAVTASQYRCVVTGR